jgi:hypothetical protein
LPRASVGVTAGMPATLRSTLAPTMVNVGSGSSP